MLKNAWNSVTSTTIKNCFIKSGFKCITNNTIKGTEEVIDSSVWDELTEKLDLSGAEFENFINVDDSLATMLKILFKLMKTVRLKKRKK